MSANPRIVDLIRLRVLYRWRGPDDGQLGVTPGGNVATPRTYSLPSVVADVDAAMRRVETHAGHDESCRCPNWKAINEERRYLAAMGLNDRAEEEEGPARRSDQCPARGPNLSHTQDVRYQPNGECLHCGRMVVP